MNFPILIIQIDVSTLIFRGISGILFISFSMKFIEANSIAPDETPRSTETPHSVVIQLGLNCLPPTELLLPVRHNPYFRTHFQMLLVVNKGEIVSISCSSTVVILQWHSEFGHSFRC